MRSGSIPHVQISLRPGRVSVIVSLSPLLVSNVLELSLLIETLFPKHCEAIDLTSLLWSFSRFPYAWAPTKSSIKTKKGMHLECL